MKQSLVLLVLLAGCMSSHDGVQSLASTDCYTCHKNDYQNTSGLAANDPAVPNHPGQNYPTTCAQCHNTTSWISHPEALFSITAPSKHADIPCATCHSDPNNNDGDYKGGNTQCATCHIMTETVGTDTQTLPQVHQTETDFSYTDNTGSDGNQWTKENFCLECHPTGVSKHHDDMIFPQTHHANTCTDCHNRATGMDTGGANAPCAPCHLAKGVRVHNQDQGDPSGCLQMGCHYGGGGGDGG